MESFAELPGWLEAFRPEDEMYRQAYENTPAERRALLKTAIAFAFHRWQGWERSTACSFSSFRTGFKHTECAEPAAWVLAWMEPGYASPARLLALLLPAVLAGVKPIAVASERPFPASLCAAMELAGLEDSFVLREEDLQRLSQELYAEFPAGRVVIFPGKNGTLSPTGKKLLTFAEKSMLPVLWDRPAPRLVSLYSAGRDAEKVKEALFWLYPDADLVDEHTQGICAAFAPREGRTAQEAPMLLGPGMEACWEGISPEFFRTRRCSAFLLQESAL